MIGIGISGTKRLRDAKEKNFWSVTLNVDEPENADQRDRNMRAFQFSGRSGAVTFNSRTSGKFEVRCVGLR